MSDHSAESVAAMERLAAHLQYLAERLIKAAGALPDGDPWVQVSAVAIELTRLARRFEEASTEDWEGPH